LDDLRDTLHKGIGMKNLISFFLAALMATAAHAQQCTTLAYLGQRQSYTLKDGATPGYNPPIIGTVTLTAPLAANLTNVVVTPLAWDFSTQDPTLTSTSEAGAAPSFTFSTDNTGNITAWYFSIATSDAGTDVWAQATSTPNVVTNGGNGAPFPGTYYDEVNNTQPSLLPPGVMDTLSTAIGAWYCLAPLVDPAVAANATLAAQVAALQSQLGTANAATAAAQAKVTADAATIAALQAQVANLQAQLAAAQTPPAVAVAPISSPSPTPVMATAPAPMQATVAPVATPAAAPVVVAAAGGTKSGGGSVSWAMIAGLALLPVVRARGKRIIKFAQKRVVVF
jgi:hypothetical protein